MSQVYKGKCPVSQMICGSVGCSPTFCQARGSFACGPHGTGGPRTSRPSDLTTTDPRSAS